MQESTRKKELLEIAKDSVSAQVIVDDIIFLESRLDELKKYPMLRVDPNNSQRQKITPAARQYKEFLQQYINCLKAFAKLTGSDFTEEESPLRIYFNQIYADSK